MQDQVPRQYVGVDLHRRRSVIVRMDQTGRVLGTTHVLNDPVSFALAVAEAGEGPEVALAKDPEEERACPPKPQE